MNITLPFPFANRVAVRASSCNSNSVDFYVHIQYIPDSSNSKWSGRWHYSLPR